MLTLYDHIESPCCQKVRLALAEKRILFKPVWVDIERGDNLDPSYLALNPKAQVPVLVHEADEEEIVISESTVICEYLEDPLTPRRTPTLNGRCRFCCRLSHRFYWRIRLCISPGDCKKKNA